MGLDLWYNKGVKRERFKSERGKAAGKSTRGAQEKASWQTAQSVVQ